MSESGDLSKSLHLMFLYPLDAEDSQFFFFWDSNYEDVAKNLLHFD